MPSLIFCIKQGLFSALGVLSKVCMLLFTACFMQIPFSEHLVVQGLQVPPHPDPPTYLDACHELSQLPFKSCCAVG